MDVGTQYGMGAATDVDAEYNNTIEDFIAAHAAQQAMMMNKSSGIPGIQQ